MRKRAVDYIASKFAIAKAIRLDVSRHRISENSQFREQLSDIALCGLIAVRRVDSAVHPRRRQFAGRREMGMDEMVIIACLD
jgi:hypothetical protein